MKITYKILFFLLCFTNLVCAQNNPSKKLKGKIIASSNDVEGVYVYNQTKKNAVITEKNGLFEIYISLGDTLLFSSVTYKKSSLLITKKEFDTDLLLVELQIATNQLEEVEVKKPTMDAVSLGILSKPAKVYTPAERRLYTASSMTVGSIITLDPLLNWISGRTKSLKTGVVIEKKNFALDKINYLFEDKYFIETLKIPEDYVEGFKYYIVEDAQIRDALNKKNKTMAKFLMSGLANQFLKDIKAE
jgi:hypothetical protein